MCCASVTQTKSKMTNILRCNHYTWLWSCEDAFVLPNAFVGLYTEEKRKSQLKLKGWDIQNPTAARYTLWQNSVEKVNRCLPEMQGTKWKDRQRQGGTEGHKGTRRETALFIILWPTWGVNSSVPRFLSWIPEDLSLHLVIICFFQAEVSLSSNFMTVYIIIY